MDKSLTSFARIALLLLLLLFLFLFLIGCRPAAAPHGDSVPYIENDYAKAVELARQTQRPILVDVWAPWCEPCKDMSKTMSSAEVSSLRDHFVWLSINADKDSAEDFFRLHPRPPMPALYVIDPTTGNVALEWHSLLGPPEMRRVLLAAEEVSKSYDWTEHGRDSRWLAAVSNMPAKTQDDRRADLTLLLGPLKRTGQHQRLLGMVLQLEVDHPTWFQYPDLRSQILEELGRRDDAKAALREAITKLEHHPSASPAFKTRMSDRMMKRLAKLEAATAAVE